MKNRAREDEACADDANVLGTTESAVSWHTLYATHTRKCTCTGCG